MRFIIAQGFKVCYNQRKHRQQKLPEASAAGADRKEREKKDEFILSEYKRHRKWPDSIPSYFKRAG